MRRQFEARAEAHLPPFRRRGFGGVMALGHMIREANETVKPRLAGPVGNLRSLEPRDAEANTGISVHCGKVPHLMRILEEKEEFPRERPSAPQGAEAWGPCGSAPSPRWHSAPSERPIVRGGSDGESPGGSAAGTPRNLIPPAACKSGHLPPSSAIPFVQRLLLWQRQEPETQYPSPIPEYASSLDLFQ